MMDENWTKPTGMDLEIGKGGTWNELSNGLSGSANGVIQHAGYPDGDIHHGLEIDPGGGGGGLGGGGAGGIQQQTWILLTTLPLCARVSRALSRTSPWSLTCRCVTGSRTV